MLYGMAPESCTYEWQQSDLVAYKKKEVKEVKNGKKRNKKKGRGKRK